MITSVTIGTLAKALSMAQAEFLPCKRTAKNPFFSSKYAPLDEVVAATQAALTKWELAVTQLTQVRGTHELVVAATKETPAKTVVIPNVELVSILMHSSGEFIGATYPVNPIKADPQGLGSAMTYARRYTMMALLGVPAEDDDGNEASRPQLVPTHASLAPATVITPEAQAAAEALKAAAKPARKQKMDVVSKVVDNPMTDANAIAKKAQEDRKLLKQGERLKLAHICKEQNPMDPKTFWQFISEQAGFLGKATDDLGLEELQKVSKVAADFIAASQAEDSAMKGELAL